MKHLFCIASHLTFNVAKKIIVSDNISPTDCYFLLLRGYRMPSEYEHVFPHQLATTYNIDSRHGRIFEGWKIWATLNNMRAFDRQIDKFTAHNDFIFYTSVCYNDICSMIVTNKLCKAYNIIEDGLVSYEKKNPETFTGWKRIVYKCFLLPCFPRIFALKNHFITTDHPKFHECIATSQLCFPMHQQHLRVIGFAFEEKEYDYRPDAVISVDPLFNSGVTLDKVEEAYTVLAGYLSTKNYQNIAVKFHPRFNAPANKAQKSAYLDILNRHINNLYELPQDVVLESLLAWCKADFYSCDSSVALYAQQTGVKCYSMMPLLEDTPAYHPTEIMNKISEPIS
ncbi:MAG: hypothetical protein IJ776_04650 [Paludibacteraceae bacterium]|nr:hypothetical protein [Paludibacteraceae bacterium]